MERYWDALEAVRDAAQGNGYSAPCADWDEDNGCSGLAVDDADGNWMYQVTVYADGLVAVSPVMGRGEYGEFMGDRRDLEALLLAALR